MGHISVFNTSVSYSSQNNLCFRIWSFAVLVVHAQDLMLEGLTNCINFSKTNVASHMSIATGECFDFCT